MFTLSHFIWLFICVFIVAGMLFLNSKKKFCIDTVVNVMLIVSVVSEVTKILCNMEDGPKGGKILDAGDLPFHLCSIQIFILFAYKFFVKDEKIKQKMLGFMVPTMFIGAIMALLIPTVGVEFTVVQVYQYFIYHAFLIFFGLYVLISKKVDWTWGVYFKNIGYLGIIALIVTWLNSALVGVLPRVNFMYLVRPPMDNLPILNLDNGWAVYIITLFAAVIVLTLIFHLIVRAIYKRERKK
jgi:hypothetical integral membrane protein (TIGR02206 family)